MACDQYPNLVEFRDLVVSLVAFSAMVPVHLRSMGIFDFPIANAKRKQVSLGLMHYEFPPKPLSDLSPLVLGLAIDPKYATTLHFLWQALNSEHPLYRFINLAIAIELLVRKDSPLPGSRHPACRNPECGFQLKVCPECNRAWTIASTLRERARFLISDATVLSRLIARRNEVFHGLPDDLPQSAAENLTDLNGSLLLVVRNYVGTKLGLPPITSKELTVALSPPDITATVFYSEKEPESTSTLPGQ